MHSTSLVVSNLLHSFGFALVFFPIIYPPSRSFLHSPAPSCTSCLFHVSCFFAGFLSRVCPLVALILATDASCCGVHKMLCSCSCKAYCSISPEPLCTKMCFCYSQHTHLRISACIHLLYASSFAREEPFGCFFLRSVDYHFKGFSSRLAAVAKPSRVSRLEYNIRIIKFISIINKAKHTHHSLC